MRTRTRGQLMRRVSRYENQSTGQDAEIIRAFIDDAYQQVSEKLAEGTSGFGLTRYSFTTGATTTTTDLPAHFYRMSEITIRPGTTEAFTPTRATPNMIDDYVPSVSDDFQLYAIEGPGQDTADGVIFTAYDQRIRWVPDLAANVPVRITYTTQPVSLADVGADPSDAYTDAAQDETISADVFSEAIEAAICGFARVYLDSKDTKARAAATQDLQTATESILGYRASRDTGVRSPWDYQSAGRNRRRWV